MNMHSQDPKEGIDEKKMESFVGLALKVLLGITVVVLVGLSIANAVV